eukprot:TRINITY_DN15859_c0_g1_i1.p2 TRINITY_DN15859_c0_g1~~TRINITY_DN15859_c0_g1_i1.p2  ORF type:complete len:151 (+),score=26.30 TRINITY_DN15859_c0_g1_i1:81-533(+)
MSSAIIFEDVFEVRNVDPDGKKFDKVSRIHCGKSDTYEMELTLDVNTDIYPLEVAQKLSVALSTTLNRDGTPDSDYFEPGADKDSLVDDFDYVMHGKVYKYIDDKSSVVPRVAVLVSFGGLLMELKGDARHLQGVELDARIYLLIRKLGM